MTTQLDCSLGIKEESVYGEAVTVDQFLEFVSEALDDNREFVQGEGMRVGSRVAREDRRELAQVAPGGSIELEAGTSGLGVLLEAALGTVTNNEVPTATGVFQQVHTPSLSDLQKSYTIQKGIPPLGGGSILAHTFTGAMCESIEFAASAGEILKVTTEWLARDVVTDEAYAAPSYAASQRLFTFTHGSIHLDSSALTVPTDTALATSAGTALANIRDFSAKWANGLDTDGFNLGGAGRRTRKNVLGMGTVEGQVTAEFDSVTLRDAYMNNETLSLVLNFTRPTEIAAGVFEALQIVVPAVKLNGELPKSNGGSVITQSIPFVGLDNTTDAPFYVVYRTQDADI